MDLYLYGKDEKIVIPCLFLETKFQLGSEKIKISILVHENFFQVKTNKFNKIIKTIYVCSNNFELKL